MNEPAKPPRYEAKDARPWVAAATAGALALITVGSVIAGFWIAGYRSGRLSPGAAHLFQNGPAARTSIQESWDKLDATRGGDGDYGWVDRRRGIVRIPVSRAIDLICAEQARREGASGPPIPSP